MHYFIMFLLYYGLFTEMSQIIHKIFRFRFKSQAKTGESLDFPLTFYLFQQNQKLSAALTAQNGILFE